jgi:hypothetical protein
MPYGQTEINQRFGGTYRLHLQNYSCYLLHAGFLLDLLFALEDGGNMFLRKICCLSTYCTHVISQKTELFITTAVKTSNPTSLQNSWETGHDLNSFLPGYESRNSTDTALTFGIWGNGSMPPKAVAVSIASTCRSGYFTPHNYLSGDILFVSFGRYAFIFRNIFCFQSKLSTLFYLAFGSILY